MFPALLFPYAAVRLAGVAGELLLGDLHEAAGNMSTDGARVTRCHEAIISVLRNLNAQFLRYLVFELIQSLAGLRYYECIAGTTLSCTHYYHLRLLVVWSRRGKSCMLNNFQFVPCGKLTALENPQLQHAKGQGQQENSVFQPGSDA
ncbi:MAG: hypothetical protein K0Q90_2026 [Paenibacillaceae bacterium]|nr:hypothetical protein [Paenibacillaceae bacterium]